jgi:alpha-L-arabinofuranosidase
MKSPVAVAGLTLTLAWPLGVSGQVADVNTVVHAQLLHSGRIDPKLFGNFVELLDDVVPGMWAELLNDRSFEGVVPPVDWCYYDGTPDICDRAWDQNPGWAYDEDKPFNGARCVRLIAGSQPATLTQSGLAVKKGLSYSFSGYLRAEPDVQVSVAIKFLLPTGEWMTLASGRLSALSTDWQKYTLELTSIGQTDRARFELRAEGQGRLWADKLSLMPKDNRSGWREDVVEAIKEVRPSIIRWGGSSIDPGQYKWKEGIGDRDRRTPWLNRNWGRIDSNDVGIDEFCQFCELTGAEPLVCVSFADGPQSAADLVQYCNGDSSTTWGAKRVANGHAAPYAVKFWQLGNEISGNDANYLRALSTFISEMKRADPGARIMASFPSQRLLDAVGKDIAYVCPHHYTPDLAECERDFNHIAEMVDHTPGCSHIRLGVTEWNIDAGSWGLGRAKQSTLEAALMNARYLNLLMRHSDKVEVACRSNLANSFCGAVIETAPAGYGVLKRASFHVMNLFSHHAKPLPLWIETFNDRLDLFACSAEDKRAGVLFAINQKPEWAQLRVRFEGFGGPAQISAAEAVCDTLNSRQPDVMNHWTAPDRVRIVSLASTPESVKLPPLSAAAIEWYQN